MPTRRRTRRWSRDVAAAVILGLVGATEAQDQPPAEVRIEAVQVEPPLRRIDVVQPPIARRIGGTVDSGFDLKAVRTAVVPPSVLTIVGKLDDDDWATREAAARELRVHDASDDALMRVLDQEGLTEEQRQRLMSVITRRVRERERGAMGIRMSPIEGLGDQRLGGVEVTEVIPGLPAERVLRPGDIIVRIDDRVISRSLDLQLHVQRLSPGRVIEVKILRPRQVAEGAPREPGWIEVGSGRWFEPVDVEFALGSYSKLGENPRGMNGETQRREMFVAEIREQWDRAAVSLDGQGTIDGTVPPEKARSPGTGGRFSP